LLGKRVAVQPNGSRLGNEVNAFTPSAVGGAAEHDGALGPYLSALRSHKLLVLVVTFATVGAAAAWLQLRDVRYEASAQVLVAPLPQDDQTFLGLQVLRDSGDPTRTVQTAATLLDSPRAATATAEELGAGWTGDRVRQAVDIQPAGESNILSVTATADSAREAQRVANRFLRTALADRDEVLSRQIAGELDRLRARQETLGDPTGTAAVELSDKISELESVEARGDPTFSLSQPATTPDSAEGAGPLIVIPIALLAGFALGSGAALLLQLFDRRVRSENDFVAAYPLPILARVPKLSRRERRQISGTGWLMPPAVHETFRTLLTQLSSLEDRPRTIMITSASTREGKTTSAINLAMAIAASGHSVILADFDLRKPAVARNLGIESEHTAASLLTSRLTPRRFARALSDVGHIPNLKVLAVRSDGGGPGLVHAFEDSVASLLEEAAHRAEYVVVDTPPLGEVSDALTFASAVDATLLVARPGRTKLRDLEFSRDLLERVGHTPLGYLLVAVPQRGTRGYYHAYGVTAPAPRAAARRAPAAPRPEPRRRTTGSS
jgi:capsular exopolysaccharide synthesis family protein